MLVTYFVNLKLLNDHLFGKELFIQFTTSAFRKLLSIYVFSYFSFGFEDMMWDLIVSVPDHCLSFYFTTHYQKADYILITKIKRNPCKKSTSFCVQIRPSLKNCLFEIAYSGV